LQHSLDYSLLSTC